MKWCKKRKKKRFLGLIIKNTTNYKSINLKVTLKFSKCFNCSYIHSIEVL